MIPHYSKIHNRFKLDGRHYDKHTLKEVAYSYVKEGLPYERQIGDFLLDWLNEKPTLVVKTSGSTGRPKQIILQKQAMVQSAIATGNYFNLNPGDRALHCLPTEYIAGKMMMVRAMILGLEIDLIQPASQPVFDPQKPYRFSAMTPMQLDKCYKIIDNIEQIIIGGAKVSEQLKQKVTGCKSQLFETYGMTETITHIAVKPISDNIFKVLPEINISQDERDCLVIEAAYLSDSKIITNDIVTIHSETEFEWLGRYDNVVNSGGVKINPEQVECQLASKIDVNFFISGVQDDQLGERLVLVLEAESNSLQKDVFNGLKKYHQPKDILFTERFAYTKSGKIDRGTTLKQILQKA